MDNNDLEFAFRIQLEEDGITDINLVNKLIKLLNKVKY